METNTKNLTSFVRDEYELFTNEVSFQYGFRGRRESYFSLRELLRIAQVFDLDIRLRADIQSATDRLEEYIAEHPHTI